MKKAFLFITVCVLNHLGLFSQAYKTINPARIAFFCNNENNIKSIRIDSVSGTGDSIYFPHPNIQQLDNNCITPFGSSWLSSKILVNTTGLNLYFNLKNDTIKINTKAVLHENWVIFELKDSLKIFGEISKMDTMNFLGILDSVKVIILHVYDRNGNLLNNNLNNTSLILSKNYGFIKTLNFSLFPGLSSYNAYFDYLEVYNLIGFTKPDIGVQNLRMKDVYNFDRGDELDISNEYNYSNPPNYGSATSIKTKLKYLDRIEVQDSFVYRMDREQTTIRSDIHWDSTSFSYIHDTIIANYGSDSWLDMLPGEPVISDYEAYIYTMTYGLNISKIKQSNSILKSGDSCWSQILSDGCNPDYTYIKGLGGPYYSCSNVNGFGGEDVQLVYYKKGSTSWGTPYNLTGINQFETGMKIQIYPNPAKDFIFINTSLENMPCKLELLNLNGCSVISITLNSNPYILDIHSLKAGIYFYCIRTRFAAGFKGKIIKY